MGNISVALCIPTYERSEIVEEFLRESAIYYLDAGMDIYFYDGSEDTKTEEVVRKYLVDDRIYYIKRPKNYTLLMSFQGFGLKKEYDFLWLFGESVRHTKEAVSRIMSELKLEYDMICVDGSIFSKTGTRIFTEPQEFMRECAWRVDYIGGTILNCHTMLRDIDWKFYNKEWKKYQSEVLSHSRFYWMRALELSKFCALNIELGKDQEDWSRLKKGSGWYNKELFFRNLCKLWVGTFESLPDSYSEVDKKAAILKSGEIVFFKNMNQFLCYRRKGIYSFGIFVQYLDTWKKVTRVPKWKLCFASLAPKWCLDIAKVPMKHRLEKFCRQHTRIIIYGAAYWGRAYAEYFDQREIKYDGFCCTRRKAGKFEFCQHPVYVFNEIKKEFDENVGIVVAIEHADEVMAKLEKEMDGGQVFYDPELGKELRYQLGYQN